MDCSKNPHGFLFGFSHIKFGISGNGSVSPTWGKKTPHIFGASSVGLPPPPLPSFARKGASLLGRWSSWCGRDAQNQRLWWCVLPIQIFDWQKFVWVVVSNIFHVHPYLGKIPILTNIFQMG